MKKLFFPLVLTAVFILSAFSSEFALAQTDGPEIKEVSIGMLFEPDHFNPQERLAPQASEVVHMNVFEGLVGKNSQGKIMPLLAESWNVENNGRTYTFQLKKNVKFHDGSDFDAESAIYSLYGMKKFFKEHFGDSGALRFKSLGQHEVVIELEDVLYDLLGVLSLPGAAMVHPRSSTLNAVAPVGTGPFKFSGWEGGQYVELVKNSGYYGRQAEIDKVRFLFISPDQTESFIDEGRIDALPFYSVRGTSEINSNYQIGVGGTGKKIVLLINGGNKIFKEVRLRRALSFGIDVDAINERLFLGHGRIMKSVLPKNHQFFVEQKIMNVYRPTVASGIMRDFGVDKKPLKVELIVPDSYYSREAAAIMSEQLAGLNVILTVKELSRQEWRKSFSENKWQLAVALDDSKLDFGQLAGSSRFGGALSPVLKQIVEQANRTKDEATKGMLYEQAQKQFHAEATSLYLIEIPKVSLWSKNLEGYDPEAPVGLNPLAGLRFK